jgi:hypothetical protein
LLYLLQLLTRTLHKAEKSSSESDQSQKRPVILTRLNMASTDKTFDIPKECKAGVVYNVGPDFEVKVEMVPVPEPGKSALPLFAYQEAPQTS